MISNESLPAWTYHNEEFFDLEVEYLFKNSWQLVCHLSNIKSEGDYFTFDFLGESIVVLRSKDQIKAFHNVCRHRGARLLDGPTGNIKNRITCPYHAWSYDLEGQLVSLPYKQFFPSVKTEELGLRPIEMELCLGFVFIRIEGSGPSVAEQFAPAMEDLSPYHFDELLPLGRVTYREREVNWKQIADNYIDALHIPIAHQGLTDLVGNSYGLEVVGDLHKMWADVRTKRDQGFSAKAYSQILPKMPHLPESKQTQWLYYRMWPSLAFDIYPEQIDFMQFIPISATKTMIREIPYALPDERREVKLARYLNWRINREVNAEDTDLINRVQAGMTSTSFQTGPLASTEYCLLDSIRKIQEILPVSRLTTAPAKGSVSQVNREMST